MTEEAILPFSFPVDVAQLPAGGRVYTLRADEQVRADVAAQLGLESIGRFVATITVAPSLGGGIEATGRFDADIVQSCVVSLQPLPSTVGESILRRFATMPRVKPVHTGPKFSGAKGVKPGAEKPEAKSVFAKSHPGSELPVEGWVDPDADVTDTIIDGQIDLGAVVVEELALALDPYPRAPGATFSGFGDSVTAEPEPPKNSPFAALADFQPKPRAQTRSKTRPKARR